jgi:integrase/recombinase XerD
MASELVPFSSLTPAQYTELADVPPELEWLANIPNAKTRRAYKRDVEEFSAFTGLRAPAELRTVARAHVIAWRKHLEARSLSPASIRRKLSALSSLFDYLCERNAVAGNPVDGVKRLMANNANNNNEGSTPALGDTQVRRLLEAPPLDTLKGVRDRAILATLLYHGIRREELCLLRIRYIQSREGVMHFRIKEKRDKTGYVPVHQAAQRLIEEYLVALGKHGGAQDKPGLDGPLFRPVKNNRTGTLDKHLDPGSVYRNIVRKYGRETSINAEVIGLCVQQGEFLDGARELHSEKVTNQRKPLFGDWIVWVRDCYTLSTVESGPKFAGCKT